MSGLARYIKITKNERSIYDMDIKELMIGDLVYSKVHRLNYKLEAKDVDVLAKVVSVSEDTITIELVNPFSDDSKYRIIQNLDSITPIPITEEILKKNGFKDYFESGFSKEYALRLQMDDFDEVSFWVEIPKSGNYMKFSYTPIGYSTRFSLARRGLYIHDLQHALRMCYINIDLKI